MESKDGEVGIRLDASLQERIGAYAARESMTPGEALSALAAAPTSNELSKPRLSTLN